MEYLHDCAVTIETYNKFTLKVTTTRRRKNCTVSYSLNHSKGAANNFSDKSGKAERPLRLSVKCLVGTDVYVLQEAVILDRRAYAEEGGAGCISIQLPTYRCILSIADVAQEEVEQLKRCIYLSYGIDTGEEENNVDAAVACPALLDNAPIDNKENKISSGNAEINRVESNVFALSKGSEGGKDEKSVAAVVNTPGKGPRKVSQSIAALFQKQASSSRRVEAAASATNAVSAAVPKSPAFTPLKKKSGSRSRGTPPVLTSRKAKSPQAEVTLTPTQKKVLLDCAAGKNVFFTGAAGTGKSHLISLVLAEVLRKYDKSSVHLTAMTGLAACNIGGVTLHQFSGVGGFNDGDDIAAATKQALCKLSVVRRWKAARCLVVDEVSMMTCDLLDLISAIAQKARAQVN